jgi:hypothetical protein
VVLYAASYMAAHIGGLMNVLHAWVLYALLIGMVLLCIGGQRIR